MSSEVEFDDDEIVGKGSFGTIVYKGTYNDKPVAVKVFPYGLDNIDQVSVTLEISNSAAHDNVVQFLKVKALEDQHFCLVLNLYNTNLENFLENQVDLGIAKSITKQIVDGVAFLHNSNIVHGNLCPSNVLIRNISKGVRVAVSDFELFEVMPSRWKEIARSSSKTFKTEWMAPEVLRQLQFFEQNWTKPDDNFDVVATFSSDVFSVGCLLYYVVTNRRHLFGLRLFREGNILQNSPTYEFQSPYLPLAYMTYQMTTVDPSKRPSLANCTSFPCFWSFEKERKFLEDLCNYIETHGDQKMISKDILRENLKEFIQKFSTDQNILAFRHKWRQVFELMKALTNSLVEKQIIIEKPAITKFWLTDFQSTFVLLIWDSFYYLKNVDQLRCHYVESNFRTTSFISSLIQFKLESPQITIEDAELLETQENVSTMVLLGSQQQELSQSLMKCSIGRSSSISTVGRTLVQNVDRSTHFKTSDKDHENFNQTEYQGLIRLHKALLTGESLNLIKHLIQNGANYEIKDNRRQGVLHLSVQGSNMEVITFLLSLKLDINEVDDLGETPLHKVRFTKHPDYLGMTNFLLNNGANLLAKDKNRNIVAHLFALAANISSEDFQIWVEGMINSGLGHIFAIHGQFGRTPLQAAMQRLDLNLTTLKLILESSKVDIDQQDDNGATLLHLALSFGRSLETIKNLMSLGANIIIKDKCKSEILYLAVVGGNKDVIYFLISRDLDVNEKDFYGNAPLHFVSGTRPKSYVELTKLLLDKGADLYSTNKNGNTLAHKMALEEAVSCKDFKIWVTAMIKNGHAHLFTICGQFGRTPLHFSMEEKNLDLETIKLIIESARLDINQPDDDSNTILHLALAFGRSLDTIKGLVELGADWKRKGMNDCSVLHSAVEGSNKEAFLFFKSLGADVNATDKDGFTPLHYVSLTRTKEYLEMTTFLLKNGANLNAEDNFGKTFDHWMSSYYRVSAKDYGVWKEGMIQLGHAAFFKQKSS